jgi:Xaa-Pro aminopeptidase
MKAGMVISNEAGYEDGKYGIRIEKRGGPVRESK